MPLFSPYQDDIPLVQMAAAIQQSIYYEFSPQRHERHRSAITSDQQQLDYYSSTSGVNLKYNKLAQIATFAALVAGTTSFAHAGTAAFTEPATNTLTQSHDPNGPVNLGSVFTANSTFSVDSLGIYRDPALTGSELVGLYDFNTRALLASAEVLLSDALSGSFLYHAITPVTLQAGHQYQVTAFVRNNPWTYGPAPTTDSRVTYNQNLYNYTNQLAFAASTGGSGTAYYGANFTIASVSAVPEPESYALMLAGLAGLSVLGKRKNKSRRA